MKIISMTFSNSYFDPLYERSSNQLLSKSTLLIVFYQEKVKINEMVKQIALSCNIKYIIMAL